MDDNIINQEVNSTSVVNEDNLFELVENNLNDSEKIDAPAYSYWRSVIKVSLETQEILSVFHYS